MKSTSYLILAACSGLLAGCAASVPSTELLNARQSYAHASAGNAARIVPAELHKAEEALAVAEKAFMDDPGSYHTKDLAYVADRKAKMAEALATTAVGNEATAKAAKDLQSTQTEIVKNAKENLAQSEANSAATSEQLASEQLARAAAEKRASDAQAELAKLAAVKNDPRGVVITLSGSVLFASNTSTLLPAAQHRLDQVADALMATKSRKLNVEGHTDSQGSASYNLELSQKRAEAVRSYIISRGYSGDLIVAHGIGKARPVSDNTSAEGRANNRRVEIIIEKDPTLGQLNDK